MTRCGYCGQQAAHRVEARVPPPAVLRFGRRASLVAAGIGGGTVQVCPAHLGRAVAALGDQPGADVSVSPVAPPGR